MKIDSPYIYGQTVITGSISITGSMEGGSYTGSLKGTSSYASTAESSSYSLTSSYAENAGTSGGGAGFPYTGSAVISGSLEITGSLNSADLDKKSDILSVAKQVTGSYTVGSTDNDTILVMSGSGEFAINSGVLDVGSTVILTKLNEEFVSASFGIGISTFPTSSALGVTIRNPYDMVVLWQKSSDYWIDLENSDGFDARIDTLESEIDRFSTYSEKTGSVITFSSLGEYGTYQNPLTGSLSLSFTDAKKGLIQKVYHQSGSMPTITGGAELGGSQGYATGSLNILFLVWRGNTATEYWITQ